MSILRQAFNPALSTPAIQSNATIGGSAFAAALQMGGSVAGEAVSYNTALKLSAYFACVTLKADTVAILPKHVYENLPNGRREKAIDHPLYPVIHSQANDYQTSASFFRMMTLNLVTHWRAYAKIVPGLGGFASQLVPLHPSKVKTESIPGGYRYIVTEGASNTPKPYNQEDIIRLALFEQEIMVDEDAIGYQRDTIGTALATLKYRGRFFRNDATPSGVVEFPGKALSDQGYKNFRQSWNEAYSGTGQHKTAILEEGAKYNRISIDPKSAQLIESEKHNAEDICILQRVPPSMIGLPSSATSWAGTGIEQQNIGYGTYTIMPIVTEFEQGLSSSLILEPDRYTIGFVMDGLLRGDSTQRYNVYSIGRALGMFTPNDLLRLENMNPRTDPGGDEYVPDMGRSLSPAQVDGGNAAEPSTEDTPPPPPVDDTTGEDAHYREIVMQAAGRLVRKEQAFIEKAYKRAHTQFDLEIEISEFYKAHALLVADTLKLTSEKAQAYCKRQTIAGAFTPARLVADISYLTALAMEGRK